MGLALQLQFPQTEIQIHLEEYEKCKKKTKKRKTKRNVYLGMSTRFNKENKRKRHCESENLE